MANDRETAQELQNILEEDEFDSLWVPENKGDDDSWGALLNENFETIVRTFVTLDERVTSNVLSIASNRNIADEANNRSLLNSAGITTINDILATLTIDLASVTNEVQLARGTHSSLNNRISVSLDPAGIRKADVVMSGIFTANYIEKEITYPSIASVLDITADVAGEEISDSSDYGIVGAAKADDEDVDNLCHVFTPSGEIKLNNQGRTVYGRTVSSFGTLLLYTYYLDGDNQQQNYIASSGEVLNVLLPKIYDYYTTPKLNQLHNKPYNTPVASSTQYGIAQLGHSNGLDADTVDTIHASNVPEANKLYPLNANAMLDDSVVEINDPEEGLNSLDIYYRKLLKNRPGDLDKNVNYYIGDLGNELFAKVAVSGIAGSVVNDPGGQFDREISTLLGQLDSTINNTTINASNISDNADAIDVINNTTIPTEIELVTSGYIAADVSLKDEILTDVSGNIGPHFSDTNAHHSSTSENINIVPASVSSPIGTFALANINTAVVESGIFNTLNVGILQVSEYTRNYSAETVYEDRFIELGMLLPDVSGIPRYDAVSSSGIPINGEYRSGFMLRRDVANFNASGDLESINEQAALVRYNNVKNTLEICRNFQSFDSEIEDDPNYFEDILTGAYTDIVVSGIATLQAKLNNKPNGRYALRDGSFIGDIYVSGNVTIEGMGMNSNIDGIIHLEGSGNIIKELQATGIELLSGAANNKVMFNYVGPSGVVDNSGESNNLLFGNSEV